MLRICHSSLCRPAVYWFGELLQCTACPSPGIFLVLPINADWWFHLAAVEHTPAEEGRAAKVL